MQDFLATIWVWLPGAMVCLLICCKLRWAYSCYWYITFLPLPCPSTGLAEASKSGCIMVSVYPNNMVPYMVIIGYPTAPLQLEVTFNNIFTRSDHSPTTMMQEFLILLAKYVEAQRHWSQSSIKTTTSLLLLYISEYPTNI